MSPEPFWRSKKLNELSEQEWESLCDGCGRCCLHKLEDEDTGEIAYTRVACRLLDLKTCRCSDYQHRTLHIPDCLDLRQNFPPPHWLPATCAYRRLAQGDDLPSWHPLITGRRSSVTQAGIKVGAYALPEKRAKDFEDYIIEWFD